VPAEDGGAAVIGIDLGGTKCHGVLADRGGTILQAVHRPTRHLPDPVDVLVGMIADLRTGARRAGRQVRAMAIGIPGVVDPRSGLVVGGGNVGWHELELTTSLADTVREPYLLENDVNLAGLGEARAGAGRGVGSLVVIAVGTGLGSAIVLGGELVRGARGAAGEVGFLLADRRQLARPGRMGMEERVGGLAVAERARELGLAVDDTAGLFRAARRGDRQACELVQDVIAHVAMTVADLAAVLDPDVVVLDGGIGRALAPFLPQLRELVAPSVLFPPELVVSALSPSAALVGAVTEAWRLAERDADRDAGGVHAGG